MKIGGAVILQLNNGYDDKITLRRGLHFHKSSGFLAYADQ